MAMKKKFQVAESKVQTNRDGITTFVFLEQENAPKYFDSHGEAETWIKEKGDYQKTHSIIEVFLDEKYL